MVAKSFPGGRPLTTGDSLDLANLANLYRDGLTPSRLVEGILARIDTSHLTHILAAHLSRDNNTPELARGALASALGCTHDWIGVADQASGFGWRGL